MQFTPKFILKLNILISNNLKKEKIFITLNSSIPGRNIHIPLYFPLSDLSCVLQTRRPQVGLPEKPEQMVK